MKLLIIGGTGGTGKQLIQQALEEGHQVTALVRNPEKIILKDAHLQIVKGDVLDLQSLKQAVRGQDGVLSVLGHKKFFIKTNILSEGTRNIIQAMEGEGVERFICVTSLGIGD